MGLGHIHSRSTADEAIAALKAEREQLLSEASAQTEPWSFGGLSRQVRKPVMWLDTSNCEVRFHQIERVDGVAICTHADGSECKQIEFQMKVA